MRLGDVLKILSYRHRNPCYEDDIILSTCYFPIGNLLIWKVSLFVEIKPSTWNNNWKANTKRPDKKSLKFTAILNWLHIIMWTVSHLIAPWLEWPKLSNMYPKWEMYILNALIRVRLRISQYGFWNLLWWKVWSHLIIVMINKTLQCQWAVVIAMYKKEELFIQSVSISTRYNTVPSNVALLPSVL